MMGSSRPGGSFPVVLAIAENLAPLIVFIALVNLVSLKAAIVGAVVIAILDGLRRYVFGLPYNRLIVLATALTVAFGLVDLFVPTPFLLQYEAALSSAIVGVGFVASTFGKTSLIQTLSERQEQSAFANRPDLHRFFNILTLIWAGYFFLTALFYLYLGLTLPLERAVTMRALWVTISLIAMIGGNALLGRWLFRLLRRRGLLPDVPE